ncbi:flagellar protein FlaG [Pseudodesulfovibrio thermohalotolerans]|uniref:flagellar protein FlaG n=1 Tax=Pseudodesulfovibrio thermohalotolerans TaxID=2880651 RepID=UPI0022B9D5A8|nr:flagellar protein FlaG [Pseudodesulfovibrio thermohalotolerans]WFS64236.1 flagellar protein FlaG [Pseudodesulfovibrio thermohalotolerans]
MNIPVMNIDIKQDSRSENVVPGRAGPKQNAPDGSIPRNDTVMAQSKAQADRQSENPTREELDTLIAEAEEHLKANNVKLKFNVLENNDTIQVEVVDSDGKTIRKIPDDELIKLTKSLKDLGQGFLDRMS